MTGAHLLTVAPLLYIKLGMKWISNEYKTLNHCLV